MFSVRMWPAFLLLAVCLPSAACSGDASGQSATSSAATIQAGTINAKGVTTQGTGSVRVQGCTIKPKNGCRIVSAEVKVFHDSNKNRKVDDGEAIIHTALLNDLAIQLQPNEEFQFFSGDLAWNPTTEFPPVIYYHVELCCGSGCPNDTVSMEGGTGFPGL